MTALIVVWVLGMAGVLFWRYWWAWQVFPIDILAAPLWPVVLPLYWAVLCLEALINADPLIERRPKNETGSSGGIGFCGLLTVLFVGLKLTHVIAWSWWWVFAPLWGGFALFLAIAALVFVIWLMFG